MADNIAESNSAVVDKLEAAGAVIIAKATMVEFAFWNGADSWGYSSLGGQPLNPYDASFETSGSSAYPECPPRQALPPSPSAVTPVAR